MANLARANFADNRENRYQAGGLFDQPKASTSRAAADSISPAVGTLRKSVWDYIASQGERGATDEECQEALGMNPSTQRPRRLELEQLGYVVPTQEKRRTRSGRQAVVFRVVRR